MKNAKKQLSVDPEVWDAVNKYAETSGLRTANNLMAAAAFEFAEAAKKGINVWHALARIAAEETETERKSPRPLPSTRTQLEISR